eukprot:3947940-Pyramimonas_sp.AAC.1
MNSPHAKGGVTTIFSDFGHLGTRPNIMRQTLVEGRVILTKLEFSWDVWVAIFNIHNFGIP